MNQTECTTHCVYLPSISNDIKRIVLTYKQCQDHLPSNLKKLILSKFKAIDHLTIPGNNCMVIFVHMPRH